MACSKPKTVTAAVVGSGARGTTYAGYALDNPDLLNIVAVADPNKVRQAQAMKEHNLTADCVYNDWQALYALGTRIADVVIIATQDQDHKDTAIKLASLGYHILLEKPMAVTPEDCEAIAEACDKADVLLMVCHVLRYLPANKRIKELIDSGAIGKVMVIQHTGPVGVYHFPHSYVRGDWRREDTSSFSLMTKCCHDIDLIRSWAGAECTSVSAMGKLVHFRAENQPEGAADRCLQCAYVDTCTFSAKNIYVKRFLEGRKWPASKIVTGDVLDIESIYQALETTRYGKCVYKCDNDVADNQVVTMTFANDVLGVFTMIACTKKLCDRETRISGTDGELICMDGLTLIHNNHKTGETRQIPLAVVPPESRLQNHTGADHFLMEAFVKQVAARIAGSTEKSDTNAKDALASHLLVFAAEHARKTETTIKIAAEPPKKREEVVEIAYDACD
jgi:predicted dehydrogenase